MPFLAQYRHAQLLAALTLLLIVRPFLDDLLGSRILDVFLVLTLISAIVAWQQTHHPRLLHRETSYHLP